MSDIEYSVEALRRAQKALADHRDNLIRERKNVQDAVEVLGVDWKTPAGKKFSEEKHDDWSRDIAKFITALNGIISMMDKAIKEYNQMDDDINNLKLK